MKFKQPWQIPLNKTPNKRKKKEQRRRTSSRHENKTKNASQKGIGTNHVPKSPPIVKKHIKKKKGMGNLN
jgi:hypothetical protein